MLCRSWGADGLADGDVSGHVLDPGATLHEPGAVGAEGVGRPPLGDDRLLEVVDELAVGVGSGEVVDDVDIGVDVVGELLGPAAAGALDEVLVNGSRQFFGWSERTVVTGRFGGHVPGEFGGFGIGEHDPGLVRATRELHVAAFTVETVGTDGDGEITCRLGRDAW